MTSLVQHLHSIASEVKLTEAEWFAGIQFLAGTGHVCSDKRQEFILLSDTLTRIFHEHAGEPTDGDGFGFMRHC